MLYHPQSRVPKASERQGKPPMGPTTYAATTSPKYYDTDMATLFPHQNKK